jgi:hypothetical protein
MRDVAHVEVAVRNAYDRTMRGRWQGATHWLLDPASPVVAPLWRTWRGRRTDFNTRNRANVADAVSRCGGQNAKPDAVISELSFGFWRHCTDAAHEKTLWVPYLHHAWPKRTDRATLDRSLSIINTARNRASHHEPLFGTWPGGSLTVTHREVLRLLDLLSPDLAAYVRRTSTAPTVLTEHP